MQEICACLSQLAAKTGMTVAAVVHAPRYEIFEMFDDILLLGMQLWTRFAMLFIFTMNLVYLRLIKHHFIRTEQLCLFYLRERIKPFAP